MHQSIRPFDNRSKLPFNLSMRLSMQSIQMSWIKYLMLLQFIETSLLSRKADCLVQGGHGRNEPIELSRRPKRRSHHQYRPYEGRHPSSLPTDCSTKPSVNTDQLTEGPRPTGLPESSSRHRRLPRGFFWWNRAQSRPPWTRRAPGKKGWGDRAPRGVQSDKSSEQRLNLSCS